MSTNIIIENTNTEKKPNILSKVDTCNELDSLLFTLIIVRDFVCLRQ